MNKINSVVLDSSNAVTDLCLLGASFVTDKSPYNQGSHRHPYTAAYDLIFGSRRHQDLTFGEIGIAYNASMRMWRSYFTQAQIFGFEFNADLIYSAEKDCLARVQYLTIDVNSKESISLALNKTGQLFDILIDDSTHLFDHQINVVAAALPFMRAGGALIVEDVFRGWPDARYEEALQPFLPYVSAATFIVTEHRLKESSGTSEPYFDNDKILVLNRNQVAMPTGQPGLSREQIPLLGSVR